MLQKNDVVYTLSRVYLWDQKKGLLISFVSPMESRFIYHGRTCYSPRIHDEIKSLVITNIRQLKCALNECLYCMLDTNRRYTGASEKANWGRQIFTTSKSYESKQCCIHMSTKKLLECSLMLSQFVRCLECRRGSDRCCLRQFYCDVFPVFSFSTFLPS